MLDPVQPLEYETGLLDTWKIQAASKGFEPETSAMPVRAVRAMCYTMRPTYEATQFGAYIHLFKNQLYGIASFVWK